MSQRSFPSICSHVSRVCVFGLCIAPFTLHLRPRISSSITAAADASVSDETSMPKVIVTKERGKRGKLIEALEEGGRFPWRKEEIITSARSGWKLGTGCLNFGMIEVGRHIIIGAGVKFFRLTTNGEHKIQMKIKGRIAAVLRATLTEGGVAALQNGA